MKMGDYFDAVCHSIWAEFPPRAFLALNWPKLYLPIPTLHLWKNPDDYETNVFAMS